MCRWNLHKSEKAFITNKCALVEKEEMAHKKSVRRK